MSNSSDSLIENMQTGVVAREAGDYQTGYQLLKESFQQAIKGTDQQTAIETANQYTIQCHLLAGRLLRQGDHQKAKEYSQKSLQVYQDLKQKDWFDAHDPALLRNYSHALLYAGHFQSAVTQLKASADHQEDPAAQGDELTHLAAAFIGLKDYPAAQEYLEKGLYLLKENDAHPINLTFALMTRATLYSLDGEVEKAQKSLDEALSLVQENDLAVREEEIKFLQDQPPYQINVLSAVAVS